MLRYWGEQTQAGSLNTDWDVCANTLLFHNSIIMRRWVEWSVLPCVPETHINVHTHTHTWLAHYLLIKGGILAQHFPKSTSSPHMTGVILRLKTLHSSFRSVLLSPLENRKIPLDGTSCHEEVQNYPDQNDRELSASLQKLRIKRFDKPFKL